MSDKSMQVAGCVSGCNVDLTNGKYVTLYENDEYQPGFSFEVSNWDAIKTAIDKMISESKADGCV